MRSERTVHENPFVIYDHKRPAFFENFNRTVGIEDPSMSLLDLPKVEPHTVHAYVEENRRLLLSLRRYIRVTIDAAQGMEMAMLLFSTSGVLMRRYGTRPFLAALQGDGICEGTVWSKELLGANAITVGLSHQKGVCSVGDENYNHTLKKYAIYYSPLVYNDFTTQEEICMSGLALVVPVERKNIDYQSYVYSIANDLMCNVFFSGSINAFYDELDQGVMQIDTSLNKGQPYITYCNRKLLKMLGIVTKDVDYKSAHELFDPAPANEKLWEIINKNQKVHDLEMDLTVQGRKVSCTVSTSPLYQPRIGPEGILFFVMTNQQISRNISSHVGNNAILTFQDIVGSSPQITSAIQKAKQISQVSGNMMLLGESGVGKDVFAQAIHNASPRRKRPFIAVNCGALPRELIASELFGYDGGAFTGAKKQGNIGKFELANGGTIFLDEIGELPLDLQATLLRVVEEKRLMRLGSNRYIDVDVKIISATNANLPEMIQQKRFRADLYYRLSMVQLQIPPLRERGEDVIELAEHFMRRTAARIQRMVPMELGTHTKELLCRLPWHGNVRELQNLMECIVQLYTNTLITPEQILENVSMPEFYQDPAPVQEPAVVSAPAPMPPPPVPPMIRHVELSAEDIRKALDACGNNKCAAARYLGISVRTLYRKMEKAGMEKGR